MPKEYRLLKILTSTLNSKEYLKVRLIKQLLRCRVITGYLWRKDDIDMELKDTCIYKHVIQYLDEVDVIKYKKGQYLTRANHNFEEIFYILEGTVQVEYATKSGKSFLVDELSSNEFAGKISYMYDQSLYCDIIAMTDASVLLINKNTFKKLQNNTEFINIFLYKNSKRIYSIYKKLMMKDLFSSEEIVSFYIMKNSQDDKLVYKSMYELCKSLSISRKNLYNTINKFIKGNYLTKDKNMLVILNKEYFYELSKYVREFNESNDSDFKFTMTC